MEYRQIANIFPMMGEQELEELSNDIMENGLHQPIVVYEGKILDGRNRYRAWCDYVGEEVTAEELRQVKIYPNGEPAMVEYDGDDPLGYVLSLNLHRRHLTASQRSMLAEEVANMELGANQYSQGRQDCLPSSHGERGSGQEVNQSEADEKQNTDLQYCRSGKISIEEAAKMLDVSPRYVREARAIKRESPDHFERIKSGELTIQQAKRELKPQIVVLPETEDSTTDLVVEFDGKPIRTLNDLLKAKTPDQKMVDRFFELDLAGIKVSKIVNELSSHPINKIMSVIYDCDEITRTLKYQANSLLEAASFYQELMGEEREEPIRRNR